MCRLQLHEDAICKIRCSSKNFDFDKTVKIID